MIIFMTGRQACVRCALCAGLVNGLLKLLKLLKVLKVSKILTMFCAGLAHHCGRLRAAVGSDGGGRGDEEGAGWVVFLLVVFAVEKRLRND